MGAGIRRNSTSATALRTPWRKNRRTALLFTGDDFSPHRLHRLRNRPNHPLRHRQVSNSPLPRPSQRLYNRLMPKYQLLNVLDMLITHARVAIPNSPPNPLPPPF